MKHLSIFIWALLCVICLSMFGQESGGEETPPETPPINETNKKIGSIQANSVNTPADTLVYGSQLESCLSLINPQVYSGGNSIQMVLGIKVTFTEDLDSPPGGQSPLTLFENSQTSSSYDDTVAILSNPIQFELIGRKLSPLLANLDQFPSIPPDVILSIEAGDIYFDNIALYAGGSPDLQTLFPDISNQQLGHGFSISYNQNMSALMLETGIFTQHQDLTSQGVNHRLWSTELSFVLKLEALDPWIDQDYLGAWSIESHLTSYPHSLAAPGTGPTGNSTLYGGLQFTLIDGQSCPPPGSAERQDWASQPHTWIQPEISPNPFQNVLKIGGSWNGQDNLTLELYHPDGRLVDEAVLSRTSASESSRTFEHRIMGQHLVPGIYFLKLSTAGQKPYIRKLVKQ